MGKFLKLLGFISISLIVKETYAASDSAGAVAIMLHNSSKTSFGSRSSYSRPVSGTVEYYCNGLYNR